MSECVADDDAAVGFEGEEPEPGAVCEREEDADGREGGGGISLDERE